MLVWINSPVGDEISSLTGCGGDPTEARENGEVIRKAPLISPSNRIDFVDVLGVVEHEACLKYESRTIALTDNL
ncbi:hypothetical protein DPMN_175042 [Dreissena polymorpha]|uniref:Uncharacterized protein n=1 Tax=Dreissena polymorpha TaxID=45954 RepID=A0A9D4IHQ4_DREPO|nr:hypothetical protein DPMN_175042 [Dreissena polymorpha]